MRIRTLNKLIESETEKYILKNSCVVVDAQNIQFAMYTNAKIPFSFGCESNKFSKHVRKLLNMFKENNVKSYFVFKGGHEDFNTKKKQINKKNPSNIEKNDFVPPIFLKNVFKEVLNEIGVHYVVCEYESKKECIALAQKLKCPILSYDIEFCFSGVDYISLSNLYLNEVDNQIECGLFKLDTFLQKYNLTDEKIVLFILLSDENIFLSDTFVSFLKHNNIPTLYYKRNLSLLKWLARHSRKDALTHIFKFIKPEVRKEFLEQESKVKHMLRREESGGLPMKYLENSHDVEIKTNDLEWFVKGIILNHIAVPYINLYKSAKMLGSWIIADKDGNDALLLSVEIIRYAYDLLTNFQNKEFTFLSINLKSEITISTSFVRKPEYEADSVVFENGWNRLRPLKLFEHFLNETLQELDFNCIERLSEDARLLIIALVYFSRKKSVDTSKEVYSVLLSYTMLGVVFHKVNESEEEIHETVFDVPIHNPTVNMDFVTESDCKMAYKLMKKYFNLANDVYQNVPDLKLIHPLVEFQHCFEHLNYLNTLCGSPYKPTVFSKTYNGTFTYQILYAMKKENCDGLDFIHRELNPAPTVLAFIRGLIQLYDELMY